MINILNKDQIEANLEDGDTIEWGDPQKIADIESESESLYEVGIVNSPELARDKNSFVVKTNELEGDFSAFSLDSLLKFNPYGIKFIKKKKNISNNQLLGIKAIIPVGVLL
jgi:hypothetical protein